MYFCYSPSESMLESLLSSRSLFSGTKDTVSSQSDSSFSIPVALYSEASSTFKLSLHVSQSLSHVTL